MSSEIIKKNIYQRIIDVQKKVTSVIKNETVKMYENDKGYKAVSHDDVSEALHLPLAEAGIFMLPDVIEYKNSSFLKKNKNGYEVEWYRTDIKIKVKWINVDDPNDFFESTGAAFALDTSDKSFAKAYSLALKIVLLKVHLLESRDEEEERVFEKENVKENQNKQIKEEKKEKQIINHAPGANQQNAPKQYTDREKYILNLRNSVKSLDITEDMIKSKFKIKNLFELTNDQLNEIKFYAEKIKGGELRANYF